MHATVPDATPAPLSALGARASAVERLEFESGTRPETGWSHGFPGRRRANGALQADHTFEGGQLETSVAFRPTTSSPHAVVHVPWLLGGADPDLPLRLHGVTTAVRKLGEAEQGARAIGRVLAWRDAAPPTALVGAIAAQPLLVPDPDGATLALDVATGSPRPGAWPDRDEAVACLLAGVPVVAVLTLEGGVLWPDLETFARLADALWERLPPAVRPWFSWGWNVRGGNDHGRRRALPGMLCFTASDAPPPESARLQRTASGALVLTLPAEPRVRALAAVAGAWTRRLQEEGADVETVAGTLGFGDVALVGAEVGPSPVGHPEAAYYRGLLQAGTPKGRTGERRVDMLDSGLPGVLRGVARAIARVDLRDGLRSWLDAAPGTAGEDTSPPTAWTGDPRDVDAVQEVLHAGWSRWEALGRPASLGRRLVLLQYRLGLRARDARSVDVRLAYDRAVEAGAAAPFAGPFAAALHALDAASSAPSWGFCRQSLARWCAVDPAVRALAADHPEVAPALGAALGQACEVVSWPWSVPHDELGSRDRRAVATDVARMLAPMMSGPHADGLLAQVASLQLVALGTETGTPGVVSGPSLARVARVAERLPPVERIDRLSPIDRRGLARVLVAYLCGDADLASLPWPEGRSHAWAWGALRALGDETALVDIAHADWFRMHIREAVPDAALLRAASESVPAALAARTMFPPPRPAPPVAAADDEDRPTVIAGAMHDDGLDDADVRTAHALLLAWPQVARLAEGSTGRHATALVGRTLLARYLPHWPPGVPELLAAGSRLRGAGPLPATDDVRSETSDGGPLPGVPLVPAITGAEFAALVRRDDLDTCGEAPWWFALRLHATGSPGDVATTMIALAAGTIPPAAPDDRAFDVAMRCVRALPAAHPRVRQLLARCEDNAVPPAASYAVVAMMTSEQVGEPTGRLLQRLRRWYVVDEHQLRRVPTIQQAFEKTHPSIEALLTANFLSLDPAQWKPGYAGTMIALCFGGVRAEALPTRHPGLWREHFKGGDLFEMGVRFAELYGRHPDQLHAVAELLAPRCESAHLSGREAAMVRARGFQAGPQGPGRSPEDLFWWTLRRWAALRHGRDVRYGSWVGQHAMEVQALLLVAAGVGVALLVVAGHVALACVPAAVGFAGALWMRRNAVGERYRVLRSRGRSAAVGGVPGDILVTDAAMRFLDLYYPHRRSDSGKPARR